jgi:arabinan endo-1,5-alpha-L-arabinosidase
MFGRSRSCILHALLFISGVVAIGCSGGGAPSSPPAHAATPSPTVTSLSLSSNSVGAGTSVSLSAKVTSSGAPVTSGSVAFLDGAAQLTTASLDSSGQASWSGTSLAAGIHTLTASYAGDAAFSASTSNPSTLTVAQPGTQTTVALTASSSSSTQGLPLELSATLSAGGNGASSIPTGTVTFVSGTITLGTANVDAGGVANFISTLLPVGDNTVIATYSGDGEFASSASTAIAVAITQPAATTYTNPLTLNVTNTIKGVSCADPAILKTQSGATNTWYMYCTSDALYPGDPHTHFINIFHSPDLVNWTYDGDAFAGLPSWANVSGAMLWAPAIEYFNGQYYLYYATPASSLAGNAAAIGVGTSATPAGPFVDAGTPVVEPELATNCCGGGYRETIDPDVIQDAGGQRYVLFGSFAGGLYVRKLSNDGLTSDKSSEVQVAVDNHYEGGNWWFHGGFYYLFASSTNCCNGPLSGYGVFVGRSTGPTGPYVDAQGIAMTAVNPGGTPVIAMNGNSVVGPGGDVIFTDEAGQDYILYHGVVSSNPYYAGAVGYTARPAFIDAIDWVNGWPVARGGLGSSDRAAPQPLPAAQPGALGVHVLLAAKADQGRDPVTNASDDFSATTLGSQWSFLHGTPSYTISGTGYSVTSVAADPISSMTSVPMLAELAPPGDYMVETTIDINLPTSGKGPDYAQSGLLIYGDDSNFVRADVYNNNDTRQVEFVKAETPESTGYPAWGGTNLGPAAVNTQITVWLRIVKRNVDGKSHYTAYSSNDGVTWIEGGTWIHALGNAEMICLYAGNQAGFTGTFHYVHVSTVQ